MLQHNSSIERYGTIDDAVLGLEVAIRDCDVVTQTAINSHLTIWKALATKARTRWGRPPVVLLYHAPMQTFFHGWRRKAGVVTLVMALATLGLWVRSRVTCDSFEMHPNDTSMFSIALNKRSIEFNHHWEEARSGESNLRSPKNLFAWSSYAADGDVPMDLWVLLG